MNGSMQTGDSIGFVSLAPRKTDGFKKLTLKRL
jgi:hypothetical protein